MQNAATEMWNLNCPSNHGGTMFRLDYISCLLTVLSTVLIGRKLWHGWAIAAVNSVVVCIIGVRTAQIGFVSANLFCIALYANNIRTWKFRSRPDPSAISSE